MAGVWEDLGFLVTAQFKPTVIMYELVAVTNMKIIISIRKDYMVCLGLCNVKSGLVCDWHGQGRQLPGIAPAQLSCYPGNIIQIKFDVSLGV